MCRSPSFRFPIVIAFTLVLLACDGSHGARGPAGPPGANSQTALIAITAEAAGANCASGGSRVNSGLDANSNTALDPAEVTGTQYVCNGASGTAGTPGHDGIQALVSTRAEAAGANCSAGGRYFAAGLDANGSGTLEAGEINSSGYICSGATGANGSPGSNAITTMVTEAAGANCTQGGVRLSTGPDTNANGTLDTAEISATRFVCNGTNGTNGVSTLIRTDAESAGSNCAYGGTRISAGPDSNGNTVLDSGEVTASAYACNGAPGPGVTWTNVSASTVQAVSNRGYMVSGTREVAITMPAAPTVGDVVQINGIGSGGWRIVQNAGQQIVTQNRAIALAAAWQSGGVVLDIGALAMSADGQRIIAGVNFGTIYYSADGGGVWLASDAPSVEWDSMAASANGRRVYAVERNGPLYVSSNGGANWTALTRPWSGIIPHIASSADGKRLLGSALSDRLYISTDSGATWTATGPVATWTALASSADGQRLVATAAFSGIYVSNDFGATWTFRSNPTYWFSLACSRDCTRVAAGEYSGQVHVSGDAGVTWTPGPVGAWYGLAMSANGQRIVAANRAGAALVSEDGGVTWAPQSALTNLAEVTMSADGFRIAAGSDSGIPIYVSGRDPLEATSVGASGQLFGAQYSGATLVYAGSGQFVLTESVGSLAGR